MVKPKILFLTCPEHGQANVHLAVIASLREHHNDDVDIYISSYESLRPRVPDGVTFKPVFGHGLIHYFKPTLEEGMTVRNTFRYVWTAPGFFNTITAVTKMLTVIHSETPEEYVKTAQAIEEVIDELDPTLVVIDSMFAQARDAAKKKGQAQVVLSPNVLKDLTMPDQGWRIFTFPVSSIGYPWPLPIHLYLPNALLLLFQTLWLFVFSSNARAKNAARHPAGYAGPMPLFAPRVAPILCVSHRDADYPTTTPADVIPCGPILLPAAAPLRAVDAALAAWIERPGRATVLVVLGSHLRLDEPDARAVLAAAAALLRARPDAQVLWKLQRFTRFALPEVDGEGGGVFGDRLRVVRWLEADPVAVLRTGRVVAFVNHGGSNSYHEALAAGVPQVILSPWYDCHDFGNRAEWLRIGKWANKSSAPLVNAAELTKALLTVVGTDPDASEAMSYRKRAQEISEVVTGRRKGWYDERTRKIEVGDEVSGRRREGRDVAAEFIWERMEEEEVKRSRAFGLDDDGSVLQSYLHLRKVEDLE